MRTREAEAIRVSPPGPKPTRASFYDRPVLEVAPDLIGCVVEHAGCSGVIVETEAYHQEEPACHAYAGLTPRTRTLFGPPAVAYVYRSYGIHALLNAVCEPEGVGAAVLIRALRPLQGIDAMRARRGGETVAERDLGSGPGRLTQALGIELGENGTSLLSGPVRILPRRGSPPEIVAGPRIGITKAVDLAWRFSLLGDQNVSRPWPWRTARAARRPARRARSGPPG
jgi:DNA-3-methyladenine glycosylase